MQQAVRDFVFDLHDATRRSLSLAELTPLYDLKLRELNDKYFTTSPWPSAADISSDCNSDEQFLLLYREMTLRARGMASGSFRFQAADFIDSWDNYTKLFAFITNVSDHELLLSPQWIYDILQEFVYQFQGFCQYRTTSRAERETQLIAARSDAWGVSAVHSTLSALISQSSAALPASSVKAQFAYFAAIELARLECLLCDYSASIATVSTLRLHDRAELFTSVPACHVNVLYHCGVSLLMLRRYPDAITVLGELTLHISRALRPGSASLKPHVQSLLQKMLEKAVGLVAMAMALAPNHRVDDQLKELIEGKTGVEKYRRLPQGDLTTFEEVFEGACPKFISPCAPLDAASSASQGGSVGSNNLCQETIRLQVAGFLGEVSQHVPMLKLRSYMRMYSSIEVAKLARFNDSSSEAVVSQLVAFHHKSIQTYVPTSVSYILLRILSLFMLILFTQFRRRRAF